MEIYECFTPHIFGLLVLSVCVCSTVLKASMVVHILTQISSCEHPLLTLFLFQYLYTHGYVYTQKGLLSTHTIIESHCRGVTVNMTDTLHFGEVFQPTLSPTHTRWPRGTTFLAWPWASVRCHGTHCYRLANKRNTIRRGLPLIPTGSCP